MKGGFLLVKQERVYNSPQISSGFALLPKYCSFKYLCDAVLTLTNVFSKDLPSDSLFKVPIGANRPQTDLILWLAGVSVQRDKWPALVECNWVQNAHNSLDVLADTNICLRIADDQHVFVFSKQSPCTVQDELIYYFWPWSCSSSCSRLLLLFMIMRLFGFICVCVYSSSSFCTF